MNSLSVVLLCLCFCGLSAADITTIRKEGLKKINDTALEIIKLGNATNTALKWKIPLIPQIGDIIYSQGEKILTHNIQETDGEIKMYYKKANIMNCKLDVYSCLATVANDGEITMKNQLRAFSSNLYLQQTSYVQQQNSVIKTWVAEVNKTEDAFRQQYNLATQQIYESKTESEVNKIVTSFVNSSKTFEKLIVRIEKGVDDVQLSFWSVAMSLLDGIRNTLGTTKNNVYSGFKTCLTLKVF